jgi:hypothetical protein
MLVERERTNLYDFFDFGKILVFKGAAARALQMLKIADNWY